MKLTNLFIGDSELTNSTQLQVLYTLGVYVIDFFCGVSPPATPPQFTIVLRGWSSESVVISLCEISSSVNHFFKRILQSVVFTVSEKRSNLIEHC
ncbi:hypothetical protein FGO68_gene770 [Halteria grandinella]|uniref:Uncharacterized protein n=1 Tax=Halteria grandinella TaxID=5974 RepID=A0A8J8NSQ4_HALGN|nr:hypothetical protein FGO68_gene770 [Halteria grandinella]